MNRGSSQACLRVSRVERERMIEIDERRRERMIVLMDLGTDENHRQWSIFGIPPRAERGLRIT
jgi:hypothetical protein